MQTNIHNCFTNLNGAICHCSTLCASLNCHCWLSGRGLWQHSDQTFGGVFGEWIKKPKHFTDGGPEENKSQRSCVNPGGMFPTRRSGHNLASQEHIITFLVGAECKQVCSWKPRWHFPTQTRFREPSCWGQAERRLGCEGKAWEEALHSPAVQENFYANKQKSLLWPILLPFPPKLLSSPKWPSAAELKPWLQKGVDLVHCPSCHLQQGSKWAGRENWNWISINKFLFSCIKQIFSNPLHKRSHKTNDVNMST